MTTIGGDRVTHSLRITSTDMLGSIRIPLQFFTYFVVILNLAMVILHAYLVENAFITVSVTLLLHLLLIYHISKEQSATFICSILLISSSE